ncbi:sulfatase-like hydrolase/transferase, partial [Candidatus Poribacteria bacterium]|nr:sulfatase-like hydrolase/transferase [Candidatus Poribacteria bacterium]
MVRPNIVLIILDDLGPYEMSFLGHKKLRTPNIDRLAAQSMRFENAYSGAPVCAPARSTLLTGTHTGHTTVRGNLGGVPLLAEDFTFAQMLKRAGYATGGYGKWGVGDVGTDGVPERHGFDEFF